MALFTINEAKCLRDGVCADVCPAGLIKINGTEFPSPIPNTEDACIHCWHCVMCCPMKAFEHQAISPSSSIVISPELPSSLEQLERLIISRKSMRSFLPKPVSQDIANR
jgi:ferredoxin